MKVIIFDIAAITAFLACVQDPSLVSAAVPVGPPALTASSTPNVAPARRLGTPLHGTPFQFDNLQFYASIPTSSSKDIKRVTSMLRKSGTGRGTHGPSVNKIWATENVEYAHKVFPVVLATAEKTKLINVVDKFLHSEDIREVFIARVYINLLLNTQRDNPLINSFMFLELDKNTLQLEWLREIDVFVEQSKTMAEQSIQKLQSKMAKIISPERRAKIKKQIDEMKVVPEHALIEAMIVFYGEKKLYRLLLASTDERAVPLRKRLYGFWKGKGYNDDLMKKTLRENTLQVSEEHFALLTKEFESA